MYISFQIYSLNINNPADCAKKFISNHRIGMILFAGIILGNLIKDTKCKKDDNIVQKSENEFTFIKEKQQ